MVKSKNIVLATMSGFGLVLAISGGAFAYEPIGVLGLYKVETPGLLGLYKVETPEAVQFDEGKINSLGCQLKREGMIKAAQGSIGIDQPNRFLLLTCDGSILTDIGKHAMFNALAGNERATVILEGPIINPSKNNGNGKIEDREYILKISHYNNKNIDSRSMSLENLNDYTSTLAGKYIIESFIGVTHASGMQTPDEVVVIYYDSPEQGERFRKNNGDVIGMIGEFNAEHLREFVYFVGKALR